MLENTPEKLSQEKDFYLPYTKQTKRPKVNIPCTSSTSVCSHDPFLTAFKKEDYKAQTLSRAIIDIETEEQWNPAEEAASLPPLKKKRTISSQIIRKIKKAACFIQDEVAEF